MWSQQIRPTQISHVALRVRNLERSATFYCDLFGLELRPAVPPGDSVCVCAAPSASSLLSFGIALIQGLRGVNESAGLDHVSLEVPSADDVDQIYDRARSKSATATEPRLYGGYYQTFVFDPDGYKIEVVSRELPDAKARTACEQREADPSRVEDNGQAKPRNNGLRRMPADLDRGSPELASS